MTSREDLRIGDAEREAAMTALREHYAQGRLTHEELDERIERTLSARTGRDLALAAADLPDLYGSGPQDDGDAHGPRGRAHGWAGEWHGGHGRRGYGRIRMGAHPASWHHHGMGRRGGPPGFPLVLLALVATVAIAGFGALKFVFLAWLVMGVVGVLRHRRGHSPRYRG
ncbi:putative membrane protein [Streptosporangium album]|uniref:Putative membrane protein n=1 Tax=Streptosporangium album TaxID=47479 RepID=A0A7W7RPW1_9ACTN|nr:DUF1707 domain-containing protein [Streptosporangium album]MBB4935961.1 putative membrane protein [Streptosporangium album]